MPETSAGLLVYRRSEGGVAFLLAHPGGPFWARRDEGEGTLAAARREFEEEVGQPVEGEFAPLTSLKQKSGKLVHAWMVEADLDLDSFRSNLFEMEWPRGSGRSQAFPEIDRVGWFGPQEALAKILPGQAGFIREAIARLDL